jgi:hypothetical protein
VHRHLSNLTDADLDHADYIHAVSNNEIEDIIDVYETDQIPDIRKLPGQPYARAKRLTVILHSRDDLPTLKARIGAVKNCEFESV